MLKNLTFVMATAVIGLAQMPAFAGDDFQACQDKLKANLNEESIAYCAGVAKAGNVDAQNLMGALYFDHEGVQPNFEQALEWSLKAAEKGNAEAQNRVGQIYINGLGVKADPAQALEWFTKAANQGDADAQVNLGMMYYTGTGVAKDEAKAIEWLAKAANPNTPKGKLVLAMMYENGIGQKEDLKAAKMLYAEVCADGKQPACDKVAELEAHEKAPAKAAEPAKAK